MMLENTPLQKRLVLIGGGHTHALVLRAWKKAAPLNTTIVLVTPETTAPYTGMLPGHIAGHYGREELDIDLARLAHQAGARIILDRATGLDREARRVQLASGESVPYDIVSLDVGATAALPGLPGFDAHAFSVKPLGPFARAWEAFVTDATLDARPPACAVIGGGVAGVELALAMAHRLRQARRTDVRVALVEARGDILGATSVRMRQVLRAACAREGIIVLTGAHVSRVTDQGLDFAEGPSLAARFVVSAAGAHAMAWLGTTRLSLTHGFIDVNRHLRTVTDPVVFAVGDCAHLTHAPRPKAGVFAVRQAPVLQYNLVAAMNDRPLRSYRPQHDYLKLIAMGPRAAMAQKFGVTVSGAWVWRLKDRIDKDFMAQLNGDGAP